MQAAVRSVREDQARAPRRQELPAALHLTTLTALQQSDASGYSREYVREQVLGWAARKWPALFAGRNAGEPNFETRTDFAEVKVATTSQGRYAWSFTARIPDEKANRDWETRVLVIGEPDHDLLIVRNGYFGAREFGGAVGQPAFLQMLIQHLDFDDGGFPVLASPRLVASDAAFENFFDHLMSPRRTLPLLAIAQGESSTPSRRAAEDAELNVWSLARKVCGLAHVVSLSSTGSSRLVQRLGREMAIRAGEARLFMPGLDKTSTRELHPCFAPGRPAHDEADVVATRARAAAYQWSISHPRRSGFDALWASATGVQGGLHATDRH